jgi:DNA-binding FrmR family transcriptional regulator
MAAIQQMASRVKRVRRRTGQIVLMKKAAEERLDCDWIYEFV